MCVCVYACVCMCVCVCKCVTRSYMYSIHYSKKPPITATSIIICMLHTLDMLRDHFQLTICDHLITLNEEKLFLERLR